MKVRTSDVSSALFRRAIVTGASSGLGLALVRLLRAQDVVVVGVARDADRLDQAMRPLGALALAHDVGNDDTEALAARLLDLAGGPPDLVVHAASTLGPLTVGDDPMPRLVDVDGPQLAEVFAVNTLGPARLLRSLHRSMRRQGGVFAAISSDAAVEAYPGWGAYGASKLALDHLLRVWAQEENGLRFLSFDPGEMDTPMHAAAMPTADRSTLRAPDDAAAELLRRLHGAFADVRKAGRAA